MGRTTTLGSETCSGRGRGRINSGEVEEEMKYVVYE
jgi:hypothetical protein